MCYHVINTHTTTGISRQTMVNYYHMVFAG